MPWHLPAVPYIGVHREGWQKLGGKLVCPSESQEHHLLHPAWSSLREVGQTCFLPSDEAPTARISYVLTKREGNSW